MINREQNNIGQSRYLPLGANWMPDAFEQTSKKSITEAATAVVRPVVKRSKSKGRQRFRPGGVRARYLWAEEQYVQGRQRQSR